MSEHEFPEQCHCARCSTPRIDPESESGESLEEAWRGEESAEAAVRIAPRFVHRAESAIVSGWSPGAVLGDALGALGETANIHSLSALIESAMQGGDVGRFGIIGVPGGPMLMEPQPGDVIFRRGEGGLAHASVIAGADYWPREQVEIAGLIPESG